MKRCISVIIALLLTQVTLANTTPPLSLSWGQKITATDIKGECFAQDTSALVRCNIQTEYFSEYNPEIRGYFHKTHGLQSVEMHFQNISPKEKLSIENELLNAFNASAQQSIFKRNTLVLGFYNDNYHQLILQHNTDIINSL